MSAVLINAVVVVIGGLIGSFLKKGIPEKIEKAVMTAMGICVVYIGISGVIKGENQLVAVISMALGVIIGTAIDIDRQLNRLGEWLEKKADDGDDNNTSLAEGFVTATLVFCIGAMAVMGSLEAGLGLKEGYLTLYTKSAIDFVTAIVLASTLGFGVCFSGFGVLIFQGVICLASGFLSPLLTVSMTNELICVGSLMIICIGLNLMEISKIKVANMMPGIVLAPVFSWVLSLIIK